MYDDFTSITTITAIIFITLTHLRTPLGQIRGVCYPFKIPGGLIGTVESRHSKASPNLVKLFVSKF